MINCYIKNTNKFVKTFESIMQASRELEVNDSNIRRILKNTRKSIKGYTFKYNIGAYN